jgi:hypothetical protein
MGTNNSKENADLTTPTIVNNNNNNTSRSSIKNKTNDYYGWQEICRCSHVDWLHGTSSMKYFRLKTLNKNFF